MAVVRTAQIACQLEGKECLGSKATNQLGSNMKEFEFWED